MKALLLLFLIFNSVVWAQTGPMKLDRPLREVSVIATENGYFPNTISVHQGESVRFFVTSTQKTPDCMVVEGHSLFLAAEQGKVSEKEVVFKEPGRYKFYCPSSKYSGSITVMEKVKAPAVVHPSAGRSVASEPMHGAWVPKDY